MLANEFSYQAQWKIVWPAWATLSVFSFIALGLTVWQNSFWSFMIWLPQALIVGAVLLIWGPKSLLRPLGILLEESNKLFAHHWHQNGTLGIFTLTIKTFWIASVVTSIFWLYGGFIYELIHGTHSLLPFWGTPWIILVVSPLILYTIWMVVLIMQHPVKSMRSWLNQEYRDFGAAGIWIPCTLAGAFGFVLTLITSIIIAGTNHDHWGWGVFVFSPLIISQIVALIVFLTVRTPGQKSTFDKKVDALFDSEALHSQPKTYHTSAALSALNDVRQQLSAAGLTSGFDLQLQMLQDHIYHLHERFHEHRANGTLSKRYDNELKQISDRLREVADSGRLATDARHDLDQHIAQELDAWSAPSLQVLDDIDDAFTARRMGAEELLPNDYKLSQLQRYSKSEHHVIVTDPQTIHNKENCYTCHKRNVMAGFCRCNYCASRFLGKMIDEIEMEQTS